MHKGLCKWITATVISAREVRVFSSIFDLPLLLLFVSIWIASAGSVSDVVVAAFPDDLLCESVRDESLPTRLRQFGPTESVDTALPWPTWRAELAPEFSLFMPLTSRSINVYQENIPPARSPPPPADTAALNINNAAVENNVNNSSVDSGGGSNGDGSGLEMSQQASSSSTLNPLQLGTHHINSSGVSNGTVGSSAMRILSRLGAGVVTNNSNNSSNSVQSSSGNNKKSWLGGNYERIADNSFHHSGGLEMGKNGHALAQDDEYDDDEDNDAEEVGDEGGDVKGNKKVYHL
eukprot:CAMPEP_0170060562 /NCGR_PEP_ID=MMETSP0019_2-20121128/2460_1 /TAXON_ID=98059 /ORGANISM="Dinobryon sp., Strain UTEXLB2267" /LENGTH=290 /DNA_ID=CAMNT_0010266177 /DNA_START=555 /DNA_END=1428 /DNA_ORIENTATION=+